MPPKASDKRSATPSGGPPATKIEGPMDPTAKAKFDEAYLKAEEQLLKPSLPGAQVLNLASLERLQEELRQQQLLQAQQRRKKKKDNSQKSPRSPKATSPTTAASPGHGTTATVSASVGSLPSVVSSPQRPTADAPVAAPTAPSASFGVEQGPGILPAPQSPSSTSFSRRSRSGYAASVKSEHIHKPLRKGDLTALVTILKPKESFRAMVRKLCTNIQYMDIQWLLELSSGGVPPAPKLSIDNLADDLLLGEGKPGIMLNSPRSVLTSLRVGINPIEVQQKPQSAFMFEPSGYQVSPEVAQRRYEFYNEQRAMKMEILKKEYEAIKNEIAEGEIIAFFKHYNPDEPSIASKLKLTMEGGTGQFEIQDAEEKGWLKIRREKSRKAIEGQRKKIEKYLKSTHELKEKMKLAAEERRKFEEELARRRLAKRKEAEEKELQQKLRQQEWQEYLKEKEEEQKEKVRQRREMLAEKERQRVAMMMEANEKKRQMLEELQREHAARLQKNKDLQMSIAEEKRQRYEAKERAAETKRLQMEEAKRLEFEQEKLRAEQIAQHKKEILDQANQRMADRIHTMNMKQQTAERRLQEAQDAWKHKTMMEALDSDLERQAKIDFVERQQRMRAFQNLRMIDAIQLKHDRILKDEELKKMVLKETLMEREEMKTNKVKVLQELSKKYDDVTQS